LSNKNTTTTTSVITTPKSKIIALLLCFFVGIFGVHNFYLGNNIRGLIQFLIAIFFGGIFFYNYELVLPPIPIRLLGIWVFIEFFIILFSRNLGSSKKVITVSTTTSK